MCSFVYNLYTLLRTRLKRHLQLEEKGEGREALRGGERICARKSVSSVVGFPGFGVRGGGE